MTEESGAERRRRVAAIRAGARSANDGRSFLLPGLLASRIARGLSQRQVAERIGGNRATVRALERQKRGAYVGTIARLCEALEVGPDDLLCADSDDG